MAKRHKARKDKADEFYTQRQDIENELQHYKEYFADSRVYCNCDNSEDSEFLKYFEDNFDVLKLKKLTLTHYNPNGNSTITIIENGKKTTCPLSNNGDFNHDSQIKELYSNDILVTNPPFSLFRKFMDVVLESEIKFLVLGNTNAITYTNIFKALFENKMWFGNTFNKSMEFLLPSNAEKYQRGNTRGEKFATVSSISWFTNMNHTSKYKPFKFQKSYRLNRGMYDKYDDFDAIEVSKSKDIPKGYDGMMGVPISFFNKIDPEQFELIGILKATKVTKYNLGAPIVLGDRKYARLIIKQLQRTTNDN